MRYLPIVFCILALLAGAVLFVSQVGQGADNVSGPLRCVYGFCIGVICFFLHAATNKVQISSSIPASVLLVLSVWAIVSVRPGTLIFIVALYGCTVLEVASTVTKTVIGRVHVNKALVM